MTKKLLYFVIPLLLIIMSVSTSKAQTTATKELRHVVLFKFKDSATPANIKTVETAFSALPQKIALIKGYEWGINNSPENLNQGLTHCFFVTFSSDKDRDAYIIHPDHVAFTKILSPFLDKVTVVDYWANK